MANLPDYIPTGGESPFGDGGFRDWIPSKQEKEEVIIGGDRPRVKGLKETKSEELTDEDLTDMGIDPVELKKQKQEEADKKANELMEDVNFEKLA